MSKLQQELLTQELDFTKISKNSIDENLDKIVKLYTYTTNQIASLISEQIQDNKYSRNINYNTVIQPIIDLRIATALPKIECSFPRSMHTDKEIREKSVEASKVLANLEIEFDLNPDLYKVLDLYYHDIFQKESNQKDENKKENLTKEQIRFVNKLMQKCKRNGLHITNPKIKDKINHLKKKIENLCIQFSDNLNNENTSFIMDESELQGLPKSWFNEERKVEEGKYKVTLKYPDVHPILDFAKNRNTRRKIYLAFNKRCVKENLPLLKEILQLRQELSKILGYETHADYVTELKMVKNKETVARFIKEMNDKFQPLLKNNLKELTEFAQKIENDPHFKLEYYDINYYMRYRTEEMFKVDMEQIKDYFPLEKTIIGVLSLYENLLGLKFVEESLNKNKWHPDVRFYSVFDLSTHSKSSNQKIGEFYLDLHPREGKFGHAAIFDLFYGGCLNHFPNSSQIARSNNQRRFSCGAMLCNFPKNEGLSFWDFTTFFHEFGHIMHLVCSKNTIPDFNGFNIELDFVEAPSQMLENWCFEPKVLEMISSHIKTGDHLPKEIAEKIKMMDNLHSGYDKSRQLMQTVFDFEIHSKSIEELDKLDITKLFHQLKKEILEIEPVEDECFPASFGHIVGGYDAGYYGYLLSETYAMDMFYEVFRKDPLSKIAGKKYRQTILEPGATKDAMDLLVKFLDREPSIDPFLESCGLVSSKGSQD